MDRPVLRNKNPKNSAKIWKESIVTKNPKMKDDFSKTRPKEISEVFDNPRIRVPIESKKVIANEINRISCSFDARNSALLMPLITF